VRPRPARAVEIEAAIDALDLDARSRPRVWLRDRPVPAPHELADVTGTDEVAPSLADLLAARRASATVSSERAPR